MELDSADKAVETVVVNGWVIEPLLNVVVTIETRVVGRVETSDVARVMLAEGKSVTVEAGAVVEV